jgi:cytochrome c
MPELLLTVFLIAGVAGPPYNVGRPAPRELIQSWDISVAPTGQGLPVGHGTAKEGERLYNLRCASCHGSKGEGKDDYPPLVGGRGSLATAKPSQTVGSFWPYATTVWDYVRRAMPYEQPGTLSPDQVYALTAFVLHLNGIVGKDEMLNEKTLPRVRMPNRDGFVADARPDILLGRGKGSRGLGGSMPR